MSHVEGFPDRDGIDKLVKFAKLLCALVQSFAPLWAKKYPDNPTIAALIVAINAVCAMLPDVESEFIHNTGDNSDVLENPENTNGINPSREPSYPPDYTGV